MRKKIRSEETVSFDIQSIAMHCMEPKALEIRFQCERKKREQRKAISYFFFFWFSDNIHCKHIRSFSLSST